MNLKLLSLLIEINLSLKNVGAQAPIIPGVFVAKTNTLLSHYGITELEFRFLKSKYNVTEMDLYKSLKYFDPNGSDMPLSKVSMLHYIDSCGSFDTPPLVKHRRIAQAVFNCMDASDKIEVISYIQDNT